MKRHVLLMMVLIAIVMGATMGSAVVHPSMDNKQTINTARLDNKSGIMSNLDNNKTLSLNSSARRVYMAIAEDPFMTQQGLASKLDLSRATIAAATATLIKFNFIRREGSKKTGHWEVIGEAAEGK